MDYIDITHYTRHVSWEVFQEGAQEQGRRLIYLTPHSDLSYTDFEFSSQDTVILGRESDGIPPNISAEIPHHLTIPMVEGMRSLNVALAGAMVLGEALRQLKHTQGTL